MDFPAALRLLNDSVDSVWRNLGTALRVSLLPIFLLILVIGALFFNEFRLLFANPGAPQQTGVGVARIFLAMAASIFLFYFSAVNWHRAVLPAHSDSRLPVLETLVYLLKSVLAVIVVMLLLFVLCLVPLTLMGGGQINVGDFANGYRQGWGHFVLTFVTTWLFWVIYVALSPSMVHSAFGGGDGLLGPLWRSEDKGPVIRATAMIITLCLLANSLIGLGLAGLPGLLQLAIHATILWFVFMVSISLMTQFYALSEKTPNVETLPADAQ